MGTLPALAVRLWVVLVLSTVGLAIAGCVAGGGEAEDAAGGGETLSEERAADAGEGEAAGAADGPAADSDVLQGESPNEAEVDPAALLETRAVIRTGQLSVTSDDVGRARQEAQQVLDRFRGYVAEEETSHDEDGEATSSRLVLRIPSADFDEAMAALGQIDDLQSAERQSEDVGTQVKDVDARIRAQEKSLARLETLMGQATKLGDVIRLESEITRRQADLDSLKAQQAYLANQTSLATITLYLSTPEEFVEPEPLGEAGFLDGLRAGWNALIVVLVGVSTVLGAAIPFAVALAILGVPMWLVIRRLLRARRARSGDPDSVAPAATDAA